MGRDPDRSLGCILTQRGDSAGVHITGALVLHPYVAEPPLLHEVWTEEPTTPIVFMKFGFRLWGEGFKAET